MKRLRKKRRETCRSVLAAQSNSFRLGGGAAGKQLFGVNPYQYWLPAYDGNFWDSGLQPHTGVSDSCLLAATSNNICAGDAFALNRVGALCCDSATCGVLLTPARNFAASLRLF
ncbi:hypothetical protein, partial [Pseudomonas syringae]|uniref:hypothetical protein n=1 Tax=Pseudomonas syringae TaxID=317 RepID=UPI001C559465